MGEGDRAQVSTYQVSQLQVDTFVLPEPKDISASSLIEFDSIGGLSLDRSLVGREEDVIESQISVEQVSEGQVGYFASSLQFDSGGRLSLRSIFEGSSEVEFTSDGTVGVDVYIDGETSEVEFISDGTIGVDRDIFTSNQIELITTGDLELIILFTNESCLIGVKNTESNVFGVKNAESNVFGIIKRCGLNES